MLYSPILHYLILHFVNVAIYYDPLFCYCTLFDVVLFSISTILMLHYVLLHYIDTELFDVEQFNVILSNVAMY